MDLTEDEVQTIEDARDLVDDLAELADGSDGGLNERNLVLLYEQLDVLHQSLAMAVAQKEGLEEAFE